MDAAAKCRGSDSRLADAEKFNFKNQSRIGWNHVSSSTFAVCESRWNGKYSLAMNFHSCDTPIPTWDNLACTELKLKGPTSWLERGIELGSLSSIIITEPSCVVDS